MNRTISASRILITLAVPAAILVFLIFVMKSVDLAGDKTLSLAITLDLLLTVPVIYYLLIRKTNIPKTTVIPITIIGLILGLYFMPIENQNYLTFFKNWLLPIIEFSILIYVAIKVSSTIKKYKELKGTSPDFYSTLKNACGKILPKGIAILMATEIAVIYYGFINWKKREIYENEFTYHKKSGSPALFGALLMIIVVETFAIHLLLANWSLLAAWILTALSVYSGIQILGFAKSLSRRPIAINENSVFLKYGILNEASIQFEDIEKIELSKKPLNLNDKLVRKLSALGELENHNIVVTLSKTHELKGIYGIKRTFKVIGFHIDEPQLFLEKLQNSMLKNEEAA